VTNLATTNQYVTLSYHVPNFTAYSGYPAGTLLTYTVGYVAPGASETVNFDFTVLSGSQTPPDGSLSTLVISDDTRGASVSRTAIVRTTPTATLDLSTQQGTVAPAGSFTYTLAFHNASAGALSGSQLSLPVPAGASFVSADGGGVLGTDSVVRWSPVAFPAGATSQVHVNLKAATATGARPALLLQAVWKDSGGLILTQASDTKAIYATPAVSYSLTTTTDPIGPGKTLQFKFTATNKATTSQYVTFSYHVPNFTAYSGYPAGTILTYAIGYVAAGASQSVNLSFTTLSGSQTPPKGSLITLVVSDDVRGAAVSRTVTVN
jgi:large repetitive protein